ncbi:MAG TPA: type II secretion system F family protein [Candidatus Nanoarchaeia archaeon]|uniref:Type II secretion system protein GspF domain-containing protein n=1 Tax=Candidatus Vogelbacteria bacterium RIFOXYD1_FULL_42_15 TaxID=1802437 RepID=A0A1G2QFG6_9BACT|nr:MAG: hypothetical protein A2607_00495 [Candidatus Vogelbacteria bacterium RIFOXYD1_FULL_42_15]HLE06295.1 type II secretion system F family protein [Candidatus Nanoarchaeia archaeon]
MKIIRRMAITASKLLSKKLKARIKSLLNYGGLNIDVNYYIGLALLLGIIFGLVAFMYDLSFREVNLATILISIGIFSLILGIFILFPYFKSEQRAKKVDERLPDFLNLMAANIRSGMTAISAMHGAAKEDFGVLSEEVENAVSASMGSESYEDILSLLLKRINSRILERIVKLLITGMKTGGDLATLVEGAAEEVTQIRVMQGELITSVRANMLFIVLIIIAGLPFLLTVSIFFVETIQNLQTQVGPSELGGGVSISDITPEFLVTMSYIIIIATSLFASVLVGAVVDSSYIQGLKYFVPLMIISIIIFLIASNVVPNVIGTLNI